MPRSSVPKSPGAGGDGSSKTVTTFVRADSTCFRDLVQRLTGPSGIEGLPPIKSPAPKPAQKLHERRKYTRPKIEIEKPFAFQFQQPMIPSSPPMYNGGSYWPSPWSCPTSPSSVIMLSPPSSLPASPIGTSVSVRCSNKRASPTPVELNRGEEEKAIKDKRFYLHPSPRSKPRIATEPELLPLFPQASPTSTPLDCV